MTTLSRQSTSGTALHMWIYTTFSVSCFGMFLIALTNPELFKISSSNPIREMMIGLFLGISAILAGEVVSKLFKVLETKR